MNDRAEQLNRLPQSHWDRWYAAERAHGRHLDEAIAAGMSVEDAADYAAAKVLGR